MLTSPPPAAGHCMNVVMPVAGKGDSPVPQRRIATKDPGMYDRYSRGPSQRTLDVNGGSTRKPSSSTPTRTELSFASERTQG